MVVKKRIGAAMATACFVLVCLTALLFFNAAEPAYNKAYADDPVLARTTNLATSDDLGQCVTPANTNDYLFNVSGYSSLSYSKIPTGTTINSYTGAYFNTNSDDQSLKNYNHFYYNSNTDETEFRSNAYAVPCSDIALTKIESGRTVVSYCNVDETSHCMYFSRYPVKSIDSSLVATFNLSQNVVDALADRLLTVKITPYILLANRYLSENLQLQTTSDNADDYVDIDCFSYNNGVVQHGSPKTLQIPSLGEGRFEMMEG
ncbi:MAG: hypothetical protein J5781_07535, partial [Clostridia bacterium]|nr:hypothetical protein [Clostridia bacterium]